MCQKTYKIHWSDTGDSHAEINAGKETAEQKDEKNDATKGICRWPNNHSKGRKRAES